MAIVTSFRFTENAGAICIDQESWHIWRRKNWFTDHLYSLVPEDLAEQYAIEMVYGGVGHPQFHFEVARAAETLIRKQISDYADSPEMVTVPNIGKCVRDAFQMVHLRRVNDKLNYLFGFDLDDFNAGYFEKDGEQCPIERAEVKQRVMDIITGKETTGYGPFSAPVEACLIGIDEQLGYSAFALKEADGVLGFQSCWFESLGQGRDGAATGFSRVLNDRFLDTRRRGEGLIPGVFILLEAILESMDHYGQDGGFVRYIIINGAGKTHAERVLDIHDDAARLSLEITRARRAGLLDPAAAQELLDALIFSRKPRETIEQDLFRRSADPRLLGKLLRGYKTGEPGLPEFSPELELFPKPAEITSELEGN